MWIPTGVYVRPTSIPDLYKRFTLGLQLIHAHVICWWHKLFCTNAKLDILVNKINVKLVKIYTWVRVNKLSLNIEKTIFMLFTPMGFPRNMDCISIDGHMIEVEQTKFLGVILDNKLNCHALCQYICGKMSKGIGIIIKTRKVFNETTLLSLYNSLILPCVSYCLHVLGKAYDTHLNMSWCYETKLYGSLLVYLRAQMLIIYIWHLIYSLSKNLCPCYEHIHV